MAKKRVPLWGKPQGFAVVDTDATRGATIGTDVYNPDGTLYEPAGSSAPAPTVSRTLWSLVASIPANVVALASLATDGWIRRDGVAITARELDAVDSAYDPTDSGMSATNVQTAIDELDAQKLADAPSDGSTYGRKNGAWAPIAGGGGGSTLVKKTADQARTSTTTLADDAELVSPLGAGSLYHIKVFVLFNQANAAMGIKFAFAYSGTLASDYYRGARASAGAAGGTDNEQTGSGSGAIGVTITQLSSASGIGYIQYDLILNTTTGGNFSFQWAQSTSAAAALTVLGGSYLEVTAF